MGNESLNLALKEWAVTIKALDEGKQILLLRKGGIREQGKDFRVIYPQFLLYPTYEHQKDYLLKEPYQTDLARVLTQNPGEGVFTVSHWAQVEAAFEVMEQDRVDALSPHFIWTTDYAQKRLYWKPRKPLSIMLLRVYRLEESRTLPVLDEYVGCKSWVNLAEDVPLGHYTPVLDDREFQRQVETLDGVLGDAVRAKVPA
ncbi:MAG: DUF1802 family protein [Chloroflexi bacterium]|nr:DUF1802 family protein [Chloroflexota bacterium]